MHGSNHRDQANPFCVFGTNGKILGWRWHNEQGRMSRMLYHTEQEALHALLRHMHGLPLHKRAWHWLRGKFR